jgi:hypothetical protein
MFRCRLLRNWNDWFSIVLSVFLSIILSPLYVFLSLFFWSRMVSVYDVANHCLSFFIIVGCLFWRPQVMLKSSCLFWRPQVMLKSSCLFWRPHVILKSSCLPLFVFIYNCIVCFSVYDFANHCLSFLQLYFLFFCVLGWRPLFVFFFNCMAT